MSKSLDSKRVLITGADGFIGSHLVERLIEYGAEVRAFVFYNSWNSIGWLSDTSKETIDNIEIFKGDIRDDSRVASAVRNCDYVFHLSSLISIPYSYQAPRAYIDTNILGALNVLQACRNSNVLNRLVHVSTSEVYGTAQTVPITESHPIVGQSPYSASKIGADVLVDSYYRSFGIPTVTARPFNTFGPRQTARAVIPTIAAQLLAKLDQLSLGALSPTRDFNYVSDTVDGLIALASCPEAEGKVINIGTGKEWSIEQTANLLMKICDHEVPIVCDQERLRPKKSEVNRLVADIKLLKDLTNWNNNITFEQGLDLTVNWMKNNLRFFDPEKYLK